MPPDLPKELGEICEGARSDLERLIAAASAASGWLREYAVIYRQLTPRVAQSAKERSEALVSAINSLRESLGGH